MNEKVVGLGRRSTVHDGRNLTCCDAGERRHPNRRRVLLNGRVVESWSVSESLSESPQLLDIPRRPLHASLHSVLTGSGTTETALPFLSPSGGGEGHRASELDGRVFLDGPPRSSHSALRVARDRPFRACGRSPHRERPFRASGLDASGYPRRLRPSRAGHERAYPAGRSLRAGRRAVLVG